jgi:hypothetical protein
MNSKNAMIMVTNVCAKIDCCMQKRGWPGKWEMAQFQVFLLRIEECLKPVTRFYFGE